MTKYHFECPICEFNDKEARSLTVAEFCGLCAADCGDEVRLIRWLPIEGKTREEARALRLSREKDKQP